MDTLHFEQWHGLTLLHLAAVAIGLLLYVALTHSGRQRRPPAAAIAWVTALVAFPYAALPAYLLFGTRKLAQARDAVGPPAGGHPPGTPWDAALAHGLDLPARRHCGRIQLHDDGAAALRSLLALLDAARTSIDLEIFILRDDPAGRPVLDALQRACRRGVRVRVLLDGMGSLSGHRRLAERLRGDGVALRWFAPLRLRLRMQFGRGNLRNHRKLVVVDGRAIWSGGRNLAEEYFQDGEEGPAWRDLSFTIDDGLGGDAAYIFHHDWELAATGASPPRPEVPHQCDTGPQAQLLPSGPNRHDDTAHALLLNALYRADHEVLAATPYFVPDDALQRALRLACRRGVDVQLLLPARSNHAMADLARERNLRELADAGVRIHLLPVMLHAKALVIDRRLATCGSLNLDARSLFLNYELTTVFHDPAQVEWLRAWFAGQRAQCTAYVPRAPGLLRDIGEGLVRTIGFQL